MGALVILCICLYFTGWQWYAVHLQSAAQQLLYDLLWDVRGLVPQPVRQPVIKAMDQQMEAGGKEWTCLNCIRSRVLTFAKRLQIFAYSNSSHLLLPCYCNSSSWLSPKMFYADRNPPLFRPPVPLCGTMIDHSRTVHWPNPQVDWMPINGHDPIK